MNRKVNTGVWIAMLLTALLIKPALAAVAGPSMPALLPTAGSPDSLLPRYHGSARRGNPLATADAAARFQSSAATTAATPRGIARRALPTWTGSFQRSGVTYRYTMVGTDPRKGPATTIIPTLIVPLRFEYPPEAAQDFAGSYVFDSGKDLVDGRTAIDGILRSPIFKPFPFEVSHVYVGTTQFADAFQRANFWSELGPRKDYHVLLKPTVMPTQTIVVPESEWWEYYDNYAGGWGPAVTRPFLEATIQGIISTLGLQPDTLPVFVLGPVIMNTGALGEHWVGDGPGSQTWVVAGYTSNGEFDGYAPDIGVLGHEVLEWMNRPQSINDVAGWGSGPDVYTDWCYASVLEVGDPLEDNTRTAGVPFATRDFIYHLPDAVFHDFFTHQRRSTSAGGLYSFFGNATGPSPHCVGDDVYQTEYVDAPGAAPGQTVLSGINDQQDVVGYYYDSASLFHGFVRKRGRFLPVEVPGATFTDPVAINRAGQIAGYYYSSGYHGFMLTNGNFQTFDFPGAVYTVVGNINSWGDVVGGYGDASGAEHGFVYRGGRYTTVDAPNAINSFVGGINDSGDLAVDGYDANYVPTAAFVRTAGLFRPASFPGATHDFQIAALDNQGRIAGIFSTDLFNTTEGYATRADGTYVRFTGTYLVNGMNNRGQVAGHRYGHGFIGTFPPTDHE